MLTSRVPIRYAAAAFVLAVLSTAGYAEQKTAKACETEWRANKASIKGSGKTKKAFMIECRSGASDTAKASKTEPAPTGQAENKSTAAPEPQRRTSRDTARPRRGSASETGAGEYASETEARRRCPGDTVVWANTRSKVYHFSGTRAYGNTKRGAYMCEKDTAAAGIRSAKNEKRPR
jgi:hypothetical protein